MKIKTPNGYIELGEWTKIDLYWLRQDLSEPRDSWARKFGHNNAVGFQIYTSYSICAPRFFGEDVRFMIEEWGSFDTRLSTNVEAAKETMDNFLQIISQ